MVIWLQKIKFSKGVCQNCILGKHPEHKYEKASHERTFAPLELIHSDVDVPLIHSDVYGSEMTFPGTSRFTS